VSCSSSCASYLKKIRCAADPLPLRATCNVQRATCNVARSKSSAQRIFCAANLKKIRCAEDSRRATLHFFHPKKDEHFLLRMSTLHFFHPKKDEHFLLRMMKICCARMQKPDKTKTKIKKTKTGLYRI
jgi:hypothetical protein